MDKFLNNMLERGIEDELKNITRELKKTKNDEKKTKTDEKDNFNSIIESVNNRVKDITKPKPVQETSKTIDYLTSLSHSLYKPEFYPWVLQWVVEQVQQCVAGIKLAENKDEFLARIDEQIFIPNYMIMGDNFKDDEYNFITYETELQLGLSSTLLKTQEDIEHFTNFKWIGEHRNIKIRAPDNLRQAQPTWFPVFKNGYEITTNRVLYLIPIYLDELEYIIYDGKKIIGNFTLIKKDEFQNVGLLFNHFNDKPVDIVSFYTQELIINKLNTTKLLFNFKFSTFKLPRHMLELRNHIAYPDGYEERVSSVYPDYDISVNSLDISSMYNNPFCILKYEGKDKKMKNVELIEFMVPKFNNNDNDNITVNLVDVYFSIDKKYMMVYSGVPYDDITITDFIYNITIPTWNHMDWIVLNVDFFEKQIGWEFRKELFNKPRAGKYNFEADIMIIDRVKTILINMFPFSASASTLGKNTTPETIAKKYNQQLLRIAEYAAFHSTSQIKLFQMETRYIVPFSGEYYVKKENEYAIGGFFPSHIRKQITNKIVSSKPKPSWYSQLSSQFSRISNLNHVR